MVNALATALLGPLAGPECRRAIARGWLILVRTLAAIAILGVALITVWYWWVQSFSTPGHLPFVELRTGLAVIEGMMVTVALVLGPAVLAGSLAGEKERGALGLLLTTGVSAREIVLGRLAGKLAQVGMILMAGLPAVILIGGLAGMSARVQAILIALPVAVALGGGGIAVFASAVSRRGRDALLSVYLVDIVFLLSPIASYFGYSSSALSWLAALNPYASLVELIWDEGLTTPLITIGLWLAMGMVCTVLAAWRLRPAALAPLSGDRLLKNAKRRGRIPPVDDRPMHWKEMYIERAAALGGAGRWIGGLLALLLAVGSLVLAGIIHRGSRLGLDQTWIDWARLSLSVAVGQSQMFVSWLIQWAIGLRAAVAISSEREHGTWDALLTSPLEGREIIRAKVWGNLHALRWLFAATLLAWTVAAFCDVILPLQYARWIVGTAVLATFMAAVGVRTSLSAPTATRAMALTIGIWMGAWVVIAMLTLIVVAFSFLVLMVVSWIDNGWMSPPTWAGVFFAWAWPITEYGLFLLATILLIADTRLRFDRISGRMTEGRVEMVVEELVHGRPLAPVPMGTIVETR